MTVGVISSEDQSSAKAYTFYAIGLLVVVNLFNYMDRMVLSVLLPDIKADLGLSDGQLGWLTGMAFAFFYATFGIPIARLADVWVRKHIISMCLVGWSAMTMLSGAASSFTSLLLTRIGVGIGESGCIPASHSIISDMTSTEQRPAAMAWHTIGATLGIMAGLAFGGYLVGIAGWRWTFVIVGAPGVLLALTVTLTLREPKRQRSAQGLGPSDKVASFGATLKRLLSVPTFRHLLLAFATATFASYGLVQWLPSYYMRTFELPPSTVGILFGFVLGVGGAIGTLAGGYLANRLMANDLRWGAWLPCIAITLSVPFLFVLLLAHSLTTALGANLLQALIAGAANGPILALIQTVAKARERAVAAALVMFSASLLGIGAGPVIVGYLSDGFLAAGYGNPLKWALLAASVFPIWASLHLALASRTLLEDAALAICSDQSADLNPLSKAEAGERNYARMEP